MAARMRPSPSVMRMESGAAATTFSSLASLSGSVRRRWIGRQRAEPDHEQGRVFLPQQGGRDHQFADPGQAPDADAVDPPAAQDAGEQALDRAGALGIEALREEPPDQAGGGGTEQQGRRRVGLHHAAQARVHDQHGLRDALKQQSVAGLHLAEPPIVALQGLLGIDQLLLERGDGLQLPADRQDMSAFTDPDGAILDRDLLALPPGLTDLAPLGRPLRAGPRAGSPRRGADCQATPCPARAGRAGRRRARATGSRCRRSSR